MSNELCFFLGIKCGSAALNSLLYYDRVSLVMNSGYAQDSRGLFGPSGADQRKAQDGCQNGQQRLDALFRTSPTKAPLGAFFLRAEVHSRRCRHSEFVAAKWHFESEAACELRGRQADSQNSGQCGCFPL